MNKAITDGVVLMPPPFANGLDQWSAGNGTPGSVTYDTLGSGVFVAADQNFDGCLEIVKTENTQKLRHTGETPILPGCYLRVTARVKAVGGPLPGVRIAGWAADSGGNHLPGVTGTGPETQLTAFGEVVEISAIVGTGARGGVDMVWTGAGYGHFGIDITGPNSSVVRIDDLVIEDVTSVFLRDLMAIVDVRDHGARGDGTGDDSAAFEAADAAAAGRIVHVPAGTYRLTGDVTMENRVSFEGTVTQPADKSFILQKNFDFESYLLAFGDEETAFRKAFQALLSPSDHESLDLNGRRIALSGPVDMQAAVPDRTMFAQRRVIRNGQIHAAANGSWGRGIVNAQASYNPSNPKTLTNVGNIGAIEIGSLVTGSGVGREVYVTDKNTGAGTLSLSAPLYDAAGTQSFKFTRFRYLLDFSGFETLQIFELEGIEFQCQGEASGVMLAKSGVSMQFRNCYFTRPRDRGITSPGRGCQGLQVDNCQFLSDESPLPAHERQSICLNATANDVKLRGNRAVHFRHFAVIGGTGATITGNHYFQGDNGPNGIRRGGVIFTIPNVQSILTGNYIDNNFVEWTNEHDSTPDFSNQYSFGALTITGNTFLASDVASWFRFIVVKPYGTGHFVHGLSVIGNSFKTLNGSIDRVESVDTSHAGLNLNRMRTIEFRGNTFNGVDNHTMNPVSVDYTRSSTAKNWYINNIRALPFNGLPRVIEALAPEGRIRDGGGNTHFDFPYVQPNYDPQNKAFRIVWSEPVKGAIRAMVRMDNPT